MDSATFLSIYTASQPFSMHALLPAISYIHSHIVRALSRNRNDDEIIQLHPLLNHPVATGLPLVGGTNTRVDARGARRRREEADDGGC